MILHLFWNLHSYDFFKLKLQNFKFSVKYLAYNSAKKDILNISLYSLNTFKDGGSFLDELILIPICEI